MIGRGIVLAGFVIVIGPGSAPTQASGGVPLQNGDRIRIKTLGSTSATTGTLVTADDAALTLALEGRDRTRKTFARSEIAKLEVARGKKRNVIWDVLGGGVVGMAVDLVGTKEGGNPCDFGACVILPAMGAGAGALVGLAIKTERWEKLPAEKVRLAVLPTQHGVQLSLSVRF